MESEIKKLVDLWLSVDKNFETKKEIEDLWKEKNLKELNKLLGKRIKFGTAGLRGPMRAGYACMNRVTVQQASQGLCMAVLQSFPNAKESGIVIGFDGRYNSHLFARLSAACFLHKNVPVYLFPSICATPHISFGIRLVHAVAGIMITASHNPKEDNGYKVYWDNGAQIIPPVDGNIHQQILNNLDLWDVQETDCDPPHPSAALLRSIGERCWSAYRAHSTSLLSAHVRCQQAIPPLRVVYTAMHGVGYCFVKELFPLYGLVDPIPVPQQVAVDPEFPTARFPNPEEAGTLKLGCEVADTHDARLVIATDPDADRFCFMEKLWACEGEKGTITRYTAHPPLRDGNPVRGHWEWRRYTGNEIGVLLAYRQLCDYKQAVRGGWWPSSSFVAAFVDVPPAFFSASSSTPATTAASSSRPDPLPHQVNAPIFSLYPAVSSPSLTAPTEPFTAPVPVPAFLSAGEGTGAGTSAAVTAKTSSSSQAPTLAVALPIGMVYSTVSSHFLQRMALCENFEVAETLTGFKWICNKMLEMEEKGIRAIFGFEEAIGYCLGSGFVYDKDGVTACAVFTELAALLYNRGLTVFSQLQTIYCLYGIDVCLNGYFVCDDAPTITSIFDRIRSLGGTDSEDYSHAGAPDTYIRTLREADMEEALDPSLGEWGPRGGRWSGAAAEYRTYTVTNLRDLHVGYDSREADGKAQLPSSSDSEMITLYFVLEQQKEAVVTLRTSGTEPKVKYYSEMMGSPIHTPTGEAISAAAQTAQALAEEERVETDKVVLQAELNRIVNAVVNVLLRPRANKMALPYKL